MVFYKRDPDEQIKQRMLQLGREFDEEVTYPPDLPNAIAQQCTGCPHDALYAAR